LHRYLWDTARRPDTGPTAPCARPKSRSSASHPRCPARAVRTCVHSIPHRDHSPPIRGTTAPARHRYGSPPRHRYAPTARLRHGAPHRACRTPGPRRRRCSAPPAGHRKYPHPPLQRRGSQRQCTTPPDTRSVRPPRLSRPTPTPSYDRWRTPPGAGDRTGGAPSWNFMPADVRRRTERPHTCAVSASKTPLGTAGLPAGRAPSQPLAPPGRCAPSAGGGGSVREHISATGRHSGVTPENRPVC
jgi:hypothetical protein